jgi:cytochrome c oxidase subunit 2
VRGTQAHGTVGPDLTHLISRQTIAAGTLPNQPGPLGAWVVSAQTIKPGCRMPDILMPGSELQQILAYLGTLH